jgi:hypothetical protein
VPVLSLLIGYPGGLLDKDAFCVRWEVKAKDQSQVDRTAMMDTSQSGNRVFKRFTTPKVLRSRTVKLFMLSCHYSLFFFIHKM